MYIYTDTLGGVDSPRITRMKGDKSHKPAVRVSFTLLSCPLLYVIVTLVERHRLALFVLIANSLCNTARYFDVAGLQRYRYLTFSASSSVTLVFHRMEKPIS